MECVHCGKDVSRQMELYESKRNIYCSKDCQESDKKVECKICGKDTGSFNSVYYYDGYYFCGQPCYFSELRLKYIMKKAPQQQEQQSTNQFENYNNTSNYNSTSNTNKQQKQSEWWSYGDYDLKKTETTQQQKQLEWWNDKKFSYDADDDNDTEADSDIKELFSAADDETICNYCNKYIKKSDKTTIMKFKEYYCGILCYEAKFKISNKWKNINRYNEENSDDDYGIVYSPPSSPPAGRYSFRTSTLGSSDSESEYASNFWQNFYKPNNSIIKQEPSYIKDSKREK